MNPCQHCISDPRKRMDRLHASLEVLRSRRDAIEDKIALVEREILDLERRRS